MQNPFKRALAAGIGLAAVAAASLVFTVPAQAASTQAPLLPVHGQAIPNHFIVVLKGGGGDGAAVARRHQVAPARVYGAALHGFAATLTPAQLSAVRADSSVAYVTSDGIAKIDATSWSAKPLPTPGTDVSPLTQKSVGPHGNGVTGQNVQTGATWGIDRVDQRNLPLNGIYRYTTVGNGVTAYVIDTGIAVANGDFGGRAIGGFTAITDGNGTNDCNGHGTHVSGTIGGTTYGVAKGVRLVAVRVLDCSGSGSFSGVIAGIDYVTYAHFGPSVANMSLGGGFNAAVNDAVTNSINEGVSYSIAAGNSATNACTTSPASTPLAITVGATDANDQRAAFSNVGPCLDIFAPGVSITSDWIGSTTARNTISGTSMAAPHVAGLACLYLQMNPTATPQTVTSVLKTDAVAGIVGNPGAGSPNLLARKWNGTVAGTGSISFEPDGSYWYQGSGGYIRAYLNATAGNDIDLYLEKWNGSAWVIVAVSVSVTPQEHIAYLGSPGYYTLGVYGFRGGGTYDVWASHPA